MKETEETSDRFERALRQWGSRPAGTSPHDAARQVDRHLPTRRPAPSRRWLLVAAAIVVGLLGAALIGHRTLHRGAIPDEYPPPLDRDVVLWWLDDHTPVYFVLTPLTSDKGES